MSSLHASREPSEIFAESGNVIVEGPDGVAFTLTPDAAEETGRKMLEAASTARRQASENSAP